MQKTPFELPIWFVPALIAGMKRGIEKEGLRITQGGIPSKTPHPKRLGSKLTHPYITTDYSENLLELITDPKSTIQEVLEELRVLHVITHEGMQPELMWPLSMPCQLPSDDEITLADYGKSNIGQLKTLYRSGLGVRYGRKMQTIAGLHYNLSIGDDLFLTWMTYQYKKENSTDLAGFKNASYLALIRNFKRLIPLTLYLLGASPSVCASFVQDRKHDLQAMTEDRSTYYRPCATSLRMGKLGYTNSVQEDLDIRYNDLGEYIAGLHRATHTPLAIFSEIGVDDLHGHPIQINDHILQIENEFYSPIRPKQPTHSGETPTEALSSRGIAYVEFRTIDLDPYSEIGISGDTARFLEILALYCLLLPSPNLLPDEEKTLAKNIETIVNYGRDSNADIQTQGGLVNFGVWATHKLHEMRKIAEVFDGYYGSNAYQDALAIMQRRVDDPDSTLSARIEKDCIRYGGHQQLGLALAKRHQESLLGDTLSLELRGDFCELARWSLAEQARLECEDTESFYSFVQRYR